MKNLIREGERGLIGVWKWSHRPLKCKEEGTTLVVFGLTVVYLVIWRLVCCHEECVYRKHKMGRGTTRRQIVPRYSASLVVSPFHIFGPLIFP